MNPVLKAGRAPWSAAPVMRSMCVCLSLATSAFPVRRRKAVRPIPRTPASNTEMGRVFVVARAILRRPAHRGIVPIYAFSSIGIAWFVESAANTAFLRVNDDAGIIGGFVAAGIVAAVNVFFSAIIGRKVIPYLFYRDPAKRTFGWAGTAIWLFLLAVWNLLAGHFRDAKASGLPAPEEAALSLFADNAFIFDSIYSYGLLAAGFAFAILAAIAGFKMDDPYPGYGEIYRRHEERCEDYAEQIDQAIDELSDIRDDAIGEARNFRDELERQFRERGVIIAKRQSLRTRYQQHQAYLEEQANALLGYYRDLNVRNRTDGQTPVGFKKRWVLPRHDIPNPGDEPTIDDEVVRAQEALKASIVEISAAYDEAVQSFEHVDKIKESLRHG